MQFTFILTSFTDFQKRYISCLYYLEQRCTCRKTMVVKDLGSDQIILGNFKTIPEIAWFGSASPRVQILAQGWFRQSGVILSSHPRRQTAYRWTQPS